ncbi:hypothetical protein CBR_g295 [Chara braunii]|uniref:Uncharacterized protein n=1 Tax=Chara braunii TaxID=69332 RepID=A0A388JQA0_CHABU|nr:hypothetical protein CBR_g295 [Chara braunii]|eukprot:GBG59965.1 hypothetical protein CBR_g295 [Chara braunii]
MHGIDQLLALAHGDRVKDKQRSKQLFVVDLDKKQAAEDVLRSLPRTVQPVLKQMKTMVELYIRLAELETRREDMNKRITLGRDFRKLSQLELVAVTVLTVVVVVCRYRVEPGYGARYHEKKRERDNSSSESGSSAETQAHKDPIRDMVPKKWKPSKGRTKSSRKSTTDTARNGNEQRSLKQEIAIVAAQTKCLFDQNTEYRKSHKRDYCTIQNVADNKAPHVTEKATSDRKTIKPVRPLVPIRYRKKFGEWQVATDVSFAFPTAGDHRTLARTIREGVSEDSPLGVFGIPAPPRKDSDKIDQELATARSFEPILVKLEEKSRQQEGLVWRAWNTVTALPYSTLAVKMCPAEVMADSLAAIIRSHILSTEHSLQDEAEPLYLEVEDEDRDMGDYDDDEGLSNKISRGSDGTGTTPVPKGSLGGYNLGSAAGRRANDDSGETGGLGADSAGTTAAAD